MVAASRCSTSCVMMMLREEPPRLLRLCSRPIAYSSGHRWDRPRRLVAGHSNNAGERASRAAFGLDPRSMRRQTRAPPAKEETGQTLAPTVEGKANVVARGETPLAELLPPSLSR